MSLLFTPPGHPRRTARAWALPLVIALVAVAVVVGLWLLAPAVVNPPVVLAAFAVGGAAAWACLPRRTTVVEVPGEPVEVSPPSAVARDAERRVRMLESAVVNARDAVVILAADIEPGRGRAVLYVNAAFTAMSGYAADEVVGRSLHYLRGPDTDAGTLLRLRDALDGGVPFKGELLNYRKDGVPYWVELDVVPVADAAGRRAHWVMIQRDATARKRAEEGMRQAQKMELVGQMAGGLAHDFNNLLTGLIGNLALLKLDAGDPNAAYLDTARTAAGRAADLTRKLLGFARKGQLKPVRTRVNDLLAEVRTLVAGTVDPRVRVEVPPAADAWVDADPTLLSQVLLNLCLNARDAMPDGGRITLQVADDPADGCVRVSVEDTGGGMTAEVRARLFEPFFTTKGVGKGTGLGLAMVHGIVQQHGGRVRCHSEVGRGTRFDIDLPRAEGPPPPPVQASGRIAWAARAAPTDTPPPVSAADADRRRTVLLVDDEPMILDLGRAVLEADGFRVLDAADGERAVEAFRGHMGQVDLVVLDLTMPGLSGQETFRRLTAIDPAVRVLFSSGYSAEDLPDAGGALGLLPKPYRPPQLLDAVRRAVGVPAAVA